MQSLYPCAITHLSADLYVEVLPVTSDIPTWGFTCFFLIQYLENTLSFTPLLQSLSTAHKICRVISGLRRGAREMFALLGSYTAYSGC
jgi:hypothetical protein